jgi:PAS domain S-box-containing protein
MWRCFLECQPFSVVLDALHDGVTIYDHAGTLIWANDKACQILGFPRAALVGRNVSEIATLPTVQAIVTQEFAGRSLTDVRHHNRRIEDYASPGYMVFSNGKKLLYTGTFVRDAQGVVQYAIYTIRDTIDLAAAQKKIDELQKLTALYRDQLQALHTQVLGQDIVYRSLAMRKVLERTLRVARLDGNVLLTGETGVGKNLLAHYLHVMSRRASGPFIDVNCASLPDSLVEAELFGYAEGAFTGATRKGKRGLLELGQGGTVFLDEIMEMPPTVQAKLLTVIEDRKMRRIGGERWINLDVRFVAATNVDPDVLRQGKTLRSDLYYRLAMSTIHIPPLRERREDIPCLIDHVLAEFNDKNGARLSLHPDVVAYLQMLPLPGNVRELRALLWELAVAVDPATEVITWQTLPSDVVQKWGRHAEKSAPEARATAVTSQRKAVEEQRLRELCRQYDGDVYAIATALGAHRTTVIRKLRHYGLSYARKRLRTVA